MFVNSNVLIKTENIWFSLWSIVMGENYLTKYAPSLRLVFVCFSNITLNGRSKPIKGCLCQYMYISRPNENLRKEVDELKVATFMYQICAAMKYIHSRNVIHLDLKVTKPLVVEINLPSSSLRPFSYIKPLHLIWIEIGLREFKPSKIRFDISARKRCIIPQFAGTWKH